MRRVRIKSETRAVYHCISRVVAGERLLDGEAKEVLRTMLRKVAAFSGVEILTYCVMSNHFHVLVRVSPLEMDKNRVGHAEILRRYRVLYGEGLMAPGMPSAELLERIFVEGGEEADRWQSRLRARMGDVSEFMRTLKQRFTIWFNQKHKRFGTLWAERFKSVLVEASPQTLQTIAAYIDLNPVRAGLVTDPAEYRWCGYAEAMAGNQPAAAGLQAVVSWHVAKEALAAYRVVLFGKGSRPRRQDDPSIDRPKAQEVLNSGGKLRREELLRCRLRYLTDGAVIGSRRFVEETGRALGFLEVRSTKTQKRLGEVPLASAETGAEPLFTWNRVQRNPSSAAVA
jgi:REP element-mobilizing transposase RayT